jgi:hypothetical protein
VLKHTDPFRIIVGNFLRRGFAVLRDDSMWFPKRQRQDEVRGGKSGKGADNNGRGKRNEVVILEG